MGYSQQEIGDLLGMSRNRISEILTNVENTIFGEIDKSYKDKRSIQQISEYYGLTQLVTWHILLTERNDLEKFQEFGKDLLLFNLLVK